MSMNLPANTVGLPPKNFAVSTYENKRRCQPVWVRRLEVELLQVGHSLHGKTDNKSCGSYVA